MGRRGKQDGPEDASTPKVGLPPASNETSACNGTALRKATRRVSQLHDTFLAPSGIRSTQRSILAHVDRLGSPTMGALAVALVIDRGALAHNLRPLERDGLLRTDVAPEDRRTRRVVLTEAGRHKLAETAPLWAQAQRRFEATFGAGEAAALRRSLGVIASSEFEGAFLRSSEREEDRTKPTSAVTVSFAIFHTTYLHNTQSLSKRLVPQNLAATAESGWNVSAFGDKPRQESTVSD